MTALFFIYQFTISAITFCVVLNTMVKKTEKALYKERNSKLDNYQNLMGLIVNSNILDSFISLLQLWIYYYFGIILYKHYYR